MDSKNLNINRLIANRAKGLRASEIGELLSLARDPEIISFAVGMPDPVIFPKTGLESVASRCFNKAGEDILQYGDVFGHRNLRKKIVELMQNKYNVSTSVDNIILTTGSMQGLDICARLLVDNGDIIVVEEPTFLDAMFTFEFSGGIIKGVACDEEGINLASLEEILESGKVKGIYVIPDFQNPTGLCWSNRRRKDFMDLVNNYDVVIIEDNPYGEIKYTADKYASLKSLDKNNQVIFSGSLSKTLSPGMRIGWLCVDDNLREVIRLIKERCDCHSSLPDHYLAAEYMEYFSYEEHVQKIIKLYKKRLDILMKAVDEYLPECSYRAPKGGFFLWLKLPDRVDCMELFQRALEEKVCFVPGKPFFPKRDNNSFIRLNFTFVNEDKITEGVKRLANALNSFSSGSVINKKV